MENMIYCFSGTGNSLSAARRIAETLGDTEIVLIADAVTEGRITPACRRVGIVCPAYYGSLPPLVERFLDRLELAGTEYVFSVVTAGAMHGRAADELRGAIEARGGQLNAQYLLRMPGNYIAMYGAWPQWLQRRMLCKAGKRAAEIGREVRGKRTMSFDKKPKPQKTIGEKMPGYGSFALDYCATEKCTGCRTCEKICPVHNIAIENSRPHFGDSCERCMACIQWCPTEAIEYKDKTAARRHYRNPNIRAADLFPKR